MSFLTNGPHCQKRLANVPFVESPDWGLWSWGIPFMRPFGDSLSTPPLFHRSSHARCLRGSEQRTEHFDLRLSREGRAGPAGRSRERSKRLARVGGEAGIRSERPRRSRRPTDPDAVLSRQLSEAKHGGEAGIRTLRRRFCNLMMAKDFWRQVFSRQYVPVEESSSRVSSSPPESTSVLATCWQRPPRSSLLVTAHPAER